MHISRQKMKTHQQQKQDKQYQVQNFSDVAEIVERVMHTQKPLIILLSGWYWFSTKKEVRNGVFLAKVQDAFLTQSYIINKSAAKLLIEEKPFIRADDWRYIKKKGVNILALKPHVVNQEWSGNLPTTIAQENPYFKGHWISKMRMYKHSFLQKVFSFLNHFEEAE